MKVVVRALLLIMVLALGAAPAGSTEASPDAPELALASGYDALRRGGQIDEVLLAMELGLDALQIEGVREARELFLRAISGIEVVYGESAQAAKARSLWRAEGSKVFKGEPYERAMAFYYAGLSYLLEREWDNARASFRGAILQDSFAEEDQFRCDSALMYYLFGWSSRQMGNADDARIGFEQAGRIRPELKAPGSDANVLFIIELGKSPRKRTDGIGHAALRFFRGKGFTESMARVRLSSQEVLPVPVAEDVFFQASTRGARRIDQILHDKVVYVEAGVGDLAATTTDLPSTPGMKTPPPKAGGKEPASNSARLLYESHATAAELDLDLFSGIAKIIASNVKATADARFWSNLPDSVHLGALALPSGRQRVSIEFLDGAGNLLPELTRDLDVDVRPGVATTVWVRSRPQFRFVSRPQQGQDPGSQGGGR